MMKIKKIELDRFEEVVEVHMQAFPAFFLTRMGPAFLKIYYKTVSQMPDGIVLGAYDECDHLVGFCAATARCHGFNKRLLLRNFFTYGMLAVRVLFTNFSAIIHILKNLSKKSEQIEDAGEYAELLSIAVSPAAQGRGVGKQLLAELEAQALILATGEISLTTDADNNEKTIGFYKSVGYEIFYEFITYPARKMLRMNKRLQ